MFGNFALPVFCEIVFLGVSAMKVNDEAASVGREERRLLAVLALLKGEAVNHVCRQYNISRSDLYKYKRRAIAAMRVAMRDHRRGPKHPPRRLAEDKERRIRTICEREPTLSSYQIYRSLETGAPCCPRTIQRVRKRFSLPRLMKRATPKFKAHRFTEAEKNLIHQQVKAKLFLGCYRLAWDLQNEYGMRISPSTAKRVKRAILAEMNPRPAPMVWRFYERHHPHRLWHGDFLEKVTLTYEDRTAYQLTLMDDYSRAYVFCDLYREPNLNTTIRALITAMRKYRTIPQALLFDNGSTFKGKLLSTFCEHLGIRLIHSSPYHPQTNGKLERAFRDDMNEFYHRRKKWIFNELRRELPAYVHYRNHVRGHLALGGKPSNIRLQEQDFFALPEVLERLEKYAWRAIGSRKVGAHGFLRLRKRNVFLHPQLQGREVNLYETAEGLQAESGDGRMFRLPKYREQLRRAFHRVRDADNQRLSLTQIYQSRSDEDSTEMLNRNTSESITEKCVPINENRPRITVAL